MADFIKQINELRKEKNAVILAHTYQPAEIQDLADYVGDSYGLSKQATKINADMIVFCGVKFMAETAAILNPQRAVVMPDATAGCPMADMITADQLRELKKQHPDATTVCYVNSTAEVKAESNICCTSSNAVRIVESIKKDKPVIFVPDRYLGRFVERRTQRKNMIIWDGFCPTHARLDPETIRQAKKEHPDAEVMVHPECMPETQDEADHIISTGQMCDLVENTTCKKFLVGTEEGIIHTLRKKAPHIEFISLSPSLICVNMKKTTVAKVIDALHSGAPRITVPAEIANQARHAIQAMLDIAG